MMNKICTLFLTATFLSCFGAAAQHQPSPHGKVCALNVGQALNNALADHLRMSGFLIKEKALPDKRKLSRAPLLFDPLEFQKHVRNYLSSVPNSSLVLYAEDQEHFCAFLWHANDDVVYVRKTNGDRYLERSASRLNANIIAGIPTSDRAAKSRASALADKIEVFRLASDGLAKELESVEEHVSSLLFPPEFHAGLSKTKHLSIVPVGGIASVPISVLRPIGNNERVVDRFSVTFLLFFSEVQLPVRRWAGSFERALVIGNPKGEDIFWKLENIPQAEVEARYVAERYKATPIIGADATTIAFIERAKEADLIYIAAHALAGGGREEDPLRDSYIAFADAKLTAATISRLPLKARLRRTQCMSNRAGAHYRGRRRGSCSSLSRCRVRKYFDDVVECQRRDDPCVDD